MATMSSVKPILTLDGAALLNETEAAIFMKISPSTIIRMREKNEIPSVKMGKSRRYRVSDLAAYIDRL